MANNVESGEILVKTNTDLNDLFRLAREAVEQDTLNEKKRDFLLKTLDWLESEFKSLGNKSKHWDIVQDMLTANQWKKLFNEVNR